jgi:hypothetical protein
MTQWIQTFSGLAFWPLDPKPEHVRIADIAHALSMKCRYNGHTRKFYSVAEHSVLVSRHVPEEDALWALLHDASEAYLPDVARPIKAAMPGFAEIEGRVMRAICAAYGLPETEPPSVKAADYAILHDEKAALMDPEAADWGLMGQGLDVAIMALEPAAANRVFLDRFFEIGGIR